MKKKITRFLLLALTMVGVGVLSSCKDYDEDRYNELKLSQNSSIADYKKMLEDEIKKLSARLDTIKSCQCTGVKVDQQTINNMVYNYFQQEGGTSGTGSAADLGSAIVNIVNQYYNQKGEDMSLYATKEYVTAVTQAITEEIANYMKDRQYTDEKINQLIAEACKCAGSVAGVTAEEVQAAIAKGLADYYTKSEVYTKAEVDQKIEDAIKALAQCGCTTEATTALINQVIKTYNFASKDDILSEADINKLIEAYVNAHKSEWTNNEGVTSAELAAEVAKQVAEAIKTITQCGCTVKTNEDVEAIIAAYLAAHPQGDGTGFTKEQIEGFIADYVKNHPSGSTVTQDDVNNWIAIYLAAHPQGDGTGFTKEQIEAMITSATSTLATTNYVDQAIIDLNIAQYLKIADLETYLVSKNYATKDEVATKADAATLTTEIARLEGLITQAQADATAALTLATAADQLSKTNADLIDGLKTTVNGMQSTLNEASTDSKQALLDAAKAQAQADANKTEIQNIWSSINDIKAKFDNYYTKGETDSKISDAIEAAKNEIATLYDKKGAADQALTDAKAYTDEAIKLVNAELKTINESITSINQTIAELTEAYKDADKKLQDQITTLNEKVGTLETTVAEHTKLISDLTSRVDAIENTLAKMITGVTIQQVNNPAIGSFSLPVGISSNILIAYYGNATKEVSFPNEAEMGIKPFVFCSTDDPIVDNMEEGYATAGTIYATVNPNTVDFTGQKFQLVNSQDKVSPIELAPAKKSDATLKFGYTRAANNAFYETEARVPASKVADANQITVDKTAIKDALSNLMNTIKDRDKSQVMPTIKEMAEVIFKTANNVLSLDAQGLKASWTDDKGEHSVYSNYNVAATSVKPLAFSSFDAIPVKQFGLRDNLPKWNKIQNFVDDMQESIHDKIKTTLNKVYTYPTVEKIKNFEIKHIEIKDLTPEQLALFQVDIDTTIYIGGLSYHMDITQDIEVPIHFEKDIELEVEFKDTVKTSVKLKEDIPVDLNGVNGKYPSTAIKIEGSLTNNDETLGAVLEVPIVDSNGKKAYYYDESGNKVYMTAKVPLSDVKVNVSATNPEGTITLDGQVIAKLEKTVEVNVPIDLKKTVTYKLVFDDNIKKSFNINKWVYFGDCKFLRDAEGNIRYSEDGTPMVYTDPNGQNDVKGIRLWVTKDISDAAESLWSSVQTQLGDVNKMLDDAADILDDVNSLLEKFNENSDKYIGNTLNEDIDEYFTKIQDYLNTINEKGVKYYNKGVNAANKVLRNLPMMLEPVIVVSSDNGIGLAGFRSNSPTTSGNITLVATTMNAEILTPCAAKVVTVNGERMTIGKRGVINVPSKYIKKGWNTVKYGALDYSGADDYKTVYFYQK